MIAACLFAALALGTPPPPPMNLAALPNWQQDYTDHASVLYEDLLANYVKSVPPKSVRGAAGYGSQAGTDVSLQLRFFKLEQVEAALGKMRIKVWWRMKWSDLRLAWDPKDYGDITEVKFHASSYSDPETADIWLPDVTPYNANVGLMHSFDPSMALVNSNGDVTWSRPGTLELLCRFSGLSKFPYGPLKCLIEVGGWMASAKTQGLKPYESGCASLVQTEQVSLSSYTEYSIINVSCAQTDYVYEGFGAEVWPSISYEVTLQRMSFYYDNMTIIPCIIYTLLSFLVFFMSFEAGERLGYGVTLCLTSEVSKTIVATQVPMCGELLWIELFFNLNLVFTMFALVESCIVLGLAYNTEEYLIPPFFNPYQWEWVHEIFCAGKANKINPDEEDEQKMAAYEASPKAKRKKAKGAQAKGMSDSAAANYMREKAGDSELTDEAFMDQAGKLLFYEKLFFRLDPDGDGSISTEDIRGVLGFTALDMTAKDMEEALYEADSEKRDGRLDRVEFVSLCAKILKNVPVEQLDSAAANYAANIEALEKRINTQWRRLANNIDRHSRFWIPFLYILTLVMLYALELDDKYDEPAQGGAFAKIGNAWDSLNPNLSSAFVPIIVTPIVIVLAVIVVAKVRRRSKERRLTRMLELTHSSSATRARIELDTPGGLARGATQARMEGGGAAPVPGWDGSPEVTTPK